MAVETNARIEFSIASVEEWEKVNPKLHQGEPVFAKKPSGKYILKVGAPGGSTYKNAVVVWDQDDAETKMTSTQEAASQAIASKNAASASASKAAQSASAAAQSAENANTWDPTYYTKTIKMTKPDNGGYNVLKLLEEIPDYYSYNYDRCGGSFSIYSYVRVGGNSHLQFPPVQCAISLPYNINTNDGYVGWSTNDTYVPIVIKNNNTNKVYWGLSMRGSGHNVLMFGAFEHNINVIDTLLSSSKTDTYDGWTILKKAEIKTIATKADLPTKLSQLTNDSNYATTNDVGTAVAGVEAKIPKKLSQLTNDSNYATTNDVGTAVAGVEAKIPKKLSQLTNDSGFAVISNGHLVINGSELWIE